MSTKFRSIMYIFQINFQETVIFSALTAFTDIIVHFLLNIKNVIEIIIPIDYLMLKYISRHLSCYFLVPALSFICSQLQVYLSAGVHTYNIRIPSKGCFFFVLVRISRVPLEKLLIILINYLCIYSSLSLYMVTRTWIYQCILSCA